jgi:hypothetical protein
MTLKTIYSDHILKKIKNILGDYKSFNKMNSLNKYKISMRLRDLSIIHEYYTILNKQEIKEIDIKEFIESKKKLNEIILDRKDKSDIYKQLVKTFDVVEKYLLEKGDIKALNIIDKKIYIENSLFLHKIIYVSFSSALSCAFRYDVISEYSENCVIKSTDFIHNLKVSIFILICSEILTQNKSSDIENSLIKCLEEYKVVDNIKLASLIKVVKSIELIFLNHVFIGKTSVITDNKTILYYIFSNEINESHFPNAHLPEIVKPQSWGSRNNLEEYIKSYKLKKDGISKCEISKLCKKIIIRSQEKKFIINENAINLFKEIDSYDYEKAKQLDLSPFIPLSIISEDKRKIEEYEDKIGKDIEKKISSSYKSVIHNIRKVEKNDKFIDYSILVEKETGIDLNTLKMSRELYYLRKSYEKKRLRCLHNTIIVLAELYKGFPIYFISCVDFRLRMYPWSFMFSRTSGVYKYLLKDFKTQKLTEDGKRDLSNAYYKIINKSGVDFENINTISDEELLKNSSFFYYKLMGIEIFEAKKNNNKTSFIIEIDQKSSSSVFLSLLLGNNELASYSNLSSINAKDPIKFLMSKSEYFTNFGLSDDVLIQIKNNRKIHKNLFMCYCYNQKQYGREKNLKEIFNINYKDSKIISSNYSSFINSLFKNLNSQIEKLNDVFDFYLKNSNSKPFIISTLDGCRLEWNSLLKDNRISAKKKIKYEDNWHSYHFQNFEENVNDVSKIKQGLIPSIIHSIDASIMRFIMNSVDEKSGYIINHLHDSIQAHPNNIRVVYECIREIYLSNVFINCLDELVFTNLRSNLISEFHCEFDEIVNIFKKEFKTVEIKGEYFNEENLYPFE